MRGAAVSVSTIVVAVVLLMVAAISLGQASDPVDGASVFKNTCSACHGRSGQGVPGAFPPLAGHARDLAAAEGGRSYLISVALFGLQGEITVDDMTYNGVMPPQGHLNDDQIAAVLTHAVTELGDLEPEAEFEPFSPEEVAAVRQEKKTPSQVYESRPDMTAEAESEISEEDMLPPPFTQAQAERGNKVYQDRCTECHGTSLEGGVVGGPPLRGSYFDQRWVGRSVAALFEYTRARMPQDRPGSLSDQSYADIVALILRANGHPPGGGELPSSSEALQRFVIGR